VLVGAPGVALGVLTLGVAPVDLRLIVIMIMIVMMMMMMMMMNSTYLKQGYIL
jgi:hypothetical protein